MLCFYSVPIAFVSSLIALEKLQKSLPFLNLQTAKKAELMANLQ